MGSVDKTTDVLIVGAGFAGAATAYHLSRQSQGSILLVDKEEMAGFHASGRNASLVLQAAHSPAIRSLTIESRKAYEARRKALGFQQNGSLLLGTEEQLRQVQDPAQLPGEFRSPRQVQRWIPALEGHTFEKALWTPSDGVIDIALLLEFYLSEARERGVQVSLRTEVESIQGTGPYRVQTNQGSIQTDVLVNAAGAWAAGLADLAGVSPLPLFPLKRHLFILDQAPPSKPDLPFVWSLDQDFYFRPESGGLLFSICDEEPAVSLEPTVSSEVAETLAEVIWRQLPALHEAMQRKVWSCFRTKTPDDHFVIGWEGSQRHFFWVAGLGGHGMACSWQVGRLAAQALHQSSQQIPPEFRPQRLLTTAP